MVQRVDESAARLTRITICPPGSRPSGLLGGYHIEEDWDYATLPWDGSGGALTVTWGTVYPWGILATAGSGALLGPNNANLGCGLTGPAMGGTTHGRSSDYSDRGGATFEYITAAAVNQAGLAIDESSSLPRRRDRR